jgi:hypothetical protein
MWQYIKSYLNFCRIAVDSEILQGRWLKSMKATYKIVSAIATVILAWWGAKELVQMLPPLGKRWWAIIILSLFSGCLLFLVGVIKSFHEKTVSKLNQQHASELNDLNSDRQARARRILKLAEALGWMNTLDHLIRDYAEDRIKKEDLTKMLKDYAGLVQTALYNCYGLSGVTKFTRGNSETIELPEHASPTTWLYHIQERLHDLIMEEMPEPDKPARKIPDSVYKI